MFLVPLNSPGIEIQGIRTVDGDRTNIVYYSDVRVDDKYLLGEVNGGLDRAARATGCRTRCGRRRTGRAAGRLNHDASGRVHVRSGGQGGGGGGTAGPGRPPAIDDKSVAYRLGRSVARLEAALSRQHLRPGRAGTNDARHLPGPDGHTGAASALPFGTDGAADDGSAEYVYRFAPLVGIYGGTLEVFRNMIAQHVLGLGKPNYSPPKAS